MNSGTVPNGSILFTWNPACVNHMEIHSLPAAQIATVGYQVTTHPNACDDFDAACKSTVTACHETSLQTSKQTFKHISQCITANSFT
jgi:hypothetical protein